MNQTILDRNNQSINVNLICYFSNNGKKYIFYDKGETVQDGLIKMYVSEENSGLVSDISQDEWNNLKKVMQGIITGNLTGIEFLNYGSSLQFNEPKVIALNDANINAIKTAYKNAVGNTVNEPVLNKDILSQSFGNNESVNTVTPEPVELSSIPNIQNTFDMESTPVNLNVAPTMPEIPSVESVTNGLENTIPTVPEMPSIEPISQVENNFSIGNDEPVLNINNIKPGGIDSGFKVSDEPNIFDNPISTITEKEINATENPMNNAFNVAPVNVIENSNINNSFENDINKKKIELNNRKIKLFEELANVYREENELLSGNEDENPLEKTASNLFNNNGTLNDNEVLN